MPVPERFSDYARGVYDEVAAQGHTDPRAIIKAVIDKYAASYIAAAGTHPVTDPNILAIFTKMIIEVAVTESGLTSVQNYSGYPAYGLFQNLTEFEGSPGRGYGYTPQELMDPITNTIIAVEALLPLAILGYEQGGVAGAANQMVTGPGGQNPGAADVPGQVAALIKSVSGDIPPELLINAQQNVWQEMRFDPVSGKEQIFVLGPQGVAIPQYVAIWLDSGGNIEDMPEGNPRTWIEYLEAGNPPQTSAPDVLSREAVFNIVDGKIRTYLEIHETPIFTEQEKTLLRTMVEEGTFFQTTLDAWGIGPGSTWQEPPPPEGADAERLALYNKYERGEALTEAEMALLMEDIGELGGVPTARGEGASSRAAREFDELWYDNLNQLPPELVEPVGGAFQDEYYRLRNEYLDVRIPQLQAEADAYASGLPFAPEEAPTVDMPEPGTMIDTAARRGEAELKARPGARPGGAPVTPVLGGGLMARGGIGMGSPSGTVGVPSTGRTMTPLGEAFAERQMARAFLGQEKKPGGAQMTQAEWDTRRESIATGKYPDIGQEFGFGTPPPPTPATTAPATPQTLAKRPAEVVPTTARKTTTTPFTGEIPQAVPPPTPAQQRREREEAGRTRLRERGVPVSPGPDYTWNPYIKRWEKMLSNA